MCSASTYLGISEYDAGSIGSRSFCLLLFRPPLNVLELVSFFFAFIRAYFSRSSSSFVIELIDDNSSAFHTVE